jgi:hypothetical protein
MNTLGLIADFLGALVLLIYATKTVGATTQADQDFVASPWWSRIGWGLIAAGFLLQLIGGLVSKSS